MARPDQGHGGATCSVQCLGTTATPASLPGNPAVTAAYLDRLAAATHPGADQVVVLPVPAWKDGVDPGWLAALEYTWSVGVAEDVARLDERARRRQRQASKVADDSPTFAVVLRRSAEWAEERSSAMRARRADVVDACGKRYRSVECGCGPRDALVRCEAPMLCDVCRRIHAVKWRKRIVAGMDEGLRAARSAYWRTPRYRRRGMVPGIYLITLTGPHSGDFGTDRDAMGLAVRRLLKHATRMGWWSTYALTWEATSGTDGLGHLHVHLAVISSWIPYSSEQTAANDPDVWRPRRKGERARSQLRRTWGLFQVWRDVLPGALVLDVKAPGQHADPAFSAGNYLAKYVTKGVEPAEFTGEKAGELLLAFRNRRKVSTSEAFYVPPITVCECCGEEYQSLGAPVSLRELNPAAFIRGFLRPLKPRPREWVQRTTRE